MERHPAAAEDDPGRGVRSRRLTARALIACGALLAVAAPAAQPESLPVRTAAVSGGPYAATAGGASTRPAISASGDLVAFDSVALGLTREPAGRVRQVYARSLRPGAVSTVALVSRAPDGQAGDGESSHAAVGGDRVAFESDATNLVAGDTNGVRDVFARRGRDPVERVSVPVGGGQADGPSGEADVSADGRRVVFVSSATNLVPGDDNGVADVFVRDLAAGVTLRVSQSARGVAGDRPSSAPAISPDGRWVSFASRARTLLAGSSDGVADVYLADLRTGAIERVSVSSGGRPQDEAVILADAPVSDVSRGGRYVVFDSDGANLVRRDRNGETDVFVRDRARGTTSRVSVDRFGGEADGASWRPSISPDGRFVAFSSLAGALAAGDGPKEDAFVYDRRLRAPFVASLGPQGQQRGRELHERPPQRPRISDDARLVAFASTARNLVAGDANEAEDVFLRIANPAAVRVRQGPRGAVRGRRPVLRLDADDPHAREFLCTLDGAPLACGRLTRLPRQRAGRHVLEVRAGGPGMLFQQRPRVLRYRIG